MPDEFHGQSPGPNYQDLLPEALKLKKFLSDRLKGQPKAIDVICSVYEDDLTLGNLDEDTEQYSGPIGVFLFLGPSGVGKTETARLLSEYFMGNKQSMIKIPCVAFSQPHMIHAIIGAPHSYIGFDKSSMLSQEYLDKKISPSKLQVKMSEEISKLINERDDLLGSARSSKKIIAELNVRIRTNRSLIGSLEDYIEFLHLQNKDEKPLAELIEDPETRKLIFNNLAKQTKQIVMSDSRDKNSLIALLVEFYTEMRVSIEATKKIETDLKLLTHKLNDISQEIKSKTPQNIPIEDKTERSKRIVILFDEIEKSNQTLHNLLLEIMEEGKVTLANGQVTDLSNAIIIMTSNIAAEKISHQMKGRIFGFSGPKKSNQLENDIWKIAKAEMEKIFSPAFIGRIDNIVVFRPLNAKDLLEILDFYITRLQNNWSNYINLEFEISPEVKDFIIKESLDHPEIGARLLRHKFKSVIKRPLGRILSQSKDLQKITFSMHGGRVVPVCK